MIDTVDVLDEAPCMESDLDVADLNRKFFSVDHWWLWIRRDP